MINFFIISYLLAAIVLLPGCVSTTGGLVLDRVGPPSVTSSASSGNGSLIVFTALDPQLQFSGINRDRHTDYKIMSDNGGLLRTVHNDTGTILGEPVSANLPAGNYTVIARANSYGLVTIPVLIVPRTITVVHLDGDSAWFDRVAPKASNPVRLPNGKIVGRRAD